MDIVEQLNKAISYIESALCDEIHLDTVAQIACVTKDSFLRFFSNMTGMTLNEYVRRRRLTLAAHELQGSRCKVIDVAVKYGWDSADAFTKAFIRQHGITPTQARNPYQPLKIYPPASFYIMVKGAKKMDFRIVETREKRVLGISRKIGGTASERFKAEHIMWADDCDHIPAKICDGYDGVWYGIWNKGSYVIARDEENVTGSKLEEHFIPGGKYAVFTTQRGGYAGDELPELHNLIHNSWLPNAGYRQVNDLEVEVYHLWTDRAERREKRYYEIWIPVEKADNL